jgi:hypothetical protein
MVRYSGCLRIVATLEPPHRQKGGALSPAAPAALERCGRMKECAERTPPRRIVICERSMNDDDEGLFGRR